MLPNSSQARESEGMAEVPVNGKVLEWARTIRGLNLDDAASLLGIQSDDLRAYELGVRKPLVGLLRSMSNKYQINFTSLLMPEPLPPEKRPTDHRTRVGSRPLSMKTLIAIEDVTEALDTFSDIANEAPGIVPPLRIGTATVDDDPEEVAARERRKFSVTVDEQRTWRSLARARIEWRKRIEARGVFTYMISMPTDELSGFSILRGDLAAICINDNEITEGAKVFTLFHEYCHLLLRQAGISDEDDNSKVEAFCNQFAASFLIPQKALRDLIREKAPIVTLPHEFTDYQVKVFASEFRVSNRAIALRLEKLGFAPEGFYARRTGPWDLPREPRPITEGSQPDYIKIQLKRIGSLHAGTVLEAVERRAINSFDASELVGLKSSSFGKLRREMHV